MGAAMKPSILVCRRVFPEIVESLAAHFEVECNQADDEWTRDEQVHSSWDGSLDCFWDPADTGQTAAESGTGIVGSRIALILYPKGVAVTTSTIIGTATIESITMKQSHDNLVMRSIKFKGYSAPTITGI